MSPSVEEVVEDVKTHGVNGSINGKTNRKVDSLLPPSSATRQPLSVGRGGMQKGKITKYQPFPQVDLPDRQWPSRVITAPPIWCSVDLRDGNQALAIPMSVEEKLEMFQTLVQIGFKEIEIGFPSASQIEFDFCRRLIEEDLVPDDVTIQVLVQAREELIRRSFEALQGARRAVMHMYNSTNPAQRRIVFGLDKPDIKAIAVNGAKLVKELVATQSDTEWVFEYTPESFVLTELDFSLEVCEAVVDVWQPTVKNKIILNLPTTVESATPNVHADQIEWFCRHLRNRDTALVSLHTHNDRGTGVAATELALMAGADRVEGTLFGNGERTGNVDIVTLALNLYTQGVDPKLDFSNLEEIKEVYERCTRLEVPIRHPYAGELVFTAFSGSHQDAINKGFAQQDPAPGALWQVPYLPMDPKDIGRNYQAIIRINSQSGKGGVAYVMESEYGYQLPKAMRKEFGKIINDLADAKGEEISNEEILRTFEQEYLHRTTPIQLETFHTETNAAAGDGKEVECIARLIMNGEPKEIRAVGNGPINAFVLALKNNGVAQFDLLSYAEHSLSRGAEAKAVAYIEIKTPNGKHYFGAAIDTNIELASIKAVLSALNRALQPSH
ncbi:MAG: 2-isopropylmalate synthase [Abitibacteriaceae bacterium]|nr:2-isopropylmalate synthase [Abditibacteriaceae bacterium]MBV9868370.1 2-isopropylmalate synthase [Abditibacteriaceae bacterium]